MLHAFCVITELSADRVELAKKVVDHNEIVLPLLDTLSMNTLGAIFNILPEVVFGCAEKLDPILRFLLMIALFDMFKFEDVIEVDIIFDMVTLDPSILEIVALELTFKLVVNKLL